MRGVFVAVLLVLLSAVPGAVKAQSQVQPAVGDPYTVSDLRVDATAETAVAARARALQEGQRAAFETLLERLVPEVERASIPPLTDDEVAQLVLGFQIFNERTSAVRYIADITVSFSQADVSALLAQTGTAFAQGGKTSVLVVPVFEAGGRRVLWQDPNPWRTAWFAAAPGSLVTTQLPFGDITDLAELSTAQAVSVDAEALMKMAGRYGAESAVVATARPIQGNQVQLTLQSVDRTGPASALVETVPLSEGVIDADRLQAAVTRTIAILDEEWRQQNLIRPGVNTTVSILVPIDSIERWLQIRNGLGNTSAISGYDVRQLTRTVASVDLKVGGSLQQLESMLARRGLELVDTYQGNVVRQFGQTMPFELIADPVLAPAQGAPAVQGGTPGFQTPVPQVPGTIAPTSGG